LVTPLLLVGVNPRSSFVEVSEGRLLVRFGSWSLETPLSNIDNVEITGPYSALKAIGVRLSFADQGLTFGTTTTAGVCISFRDAVPAALPCGLLHHPSLTVTVQEPALLLEALKAPQGER
jgi:hypothetical protein